MSNLVLELTPGEFLFLYRVVETEILRRRTIEANYHGWKVAEDFKPQNTVFAKLQALQGGCHE